MLLIAMTKFVHKARKNEDYCYLINSNSKTLSTEDTLILKILTKCEKKVPIGINQI